MQSTRGNVARIRACTLGIVVLFVLVSMCIPAQVVAGALSKGYEAKTDLPVGAVVSTVKGSTTQVEKTTIANDDLIAGVVVAAGNALVNVQAKGSQVSVGVDGEVKIMVSTVNGAIKPGDKLIASPLAGVATADDPPAPGVVYIAVASQDFDERSPGAKKVTINLENGKTKEVSIGLISAKMLLGSRTQNNKNQNALTAIGAQISGRDVSLMQVLAALVIFLATATLCGVILFGSIRGTFISIGRNPLAKSTLMVGLLRVIALSIVILAVGSVIAYFVLRL